MVFVVVYKIKNTIRESESTYMAKELALDGWGGMGETAQTVATTREPAVQQC